MATIATLAAKLQVDGGDQFRAEIERSIEKVEKLQRHVRNLKDQVSAVGKTPVKLQLNGADAFAGKLSVINKTAFAAGDSVSKATGKMALGLNDAQRAMRGLAATSGGLGKLAPIVEAIASPAGLAALALGGLAVVVAKVYAEYDEFARRDIRDKLATEAGAVAVATAEWNAFYDALARGSDDAGAESARNLAGASSALAENLKRASAEIKRLEDSNKKLGGMSVVGMSDSDVAAVVAQINRQEAAIDDLRETMTELAKGTGVVVNTAKAHADAEKAREAALKKSADEAKRLREEMEKINQAAAGTIQGVLSSVTAGFTVSKPQRGASAYVDLFGPLVTALENATEAYKKAIPPVAIDKTLAAGIGGPTGAIIEGAQSGGIKGALLAMIMQSEQFGKLVGFLNEHVQRIANTLGAFIEPLIPIVEEVVETFRPMLEAARPLIALYQAMNPAVLVASAAIRILGDVIGSVTRTITGFLLGFLKMVRKLLDRMHISWKPLDNAIDDLRKSMKDTAKAADDAAQALGAIIPEGYKLVEFRKFNASPAQQTYYGPNGVTTGGGLQSGSGGPASATASGATSGEVGSLAGATFILHGVSDVPSLWRELQRVGQRQGTIRSGRSVYSGGV